MEAELAALKAEVRSRAPVRQPFRPVAGPPPIPAQEPCWEEEPETASVLKRMTRGDYTLAFLIVQVLCLLSGLVVTQENLGGVAIFSYVVGGGILVVPTMMRLKDTGHSPWWGLCVFLPIGYLCVTLHCLSYPPMEMRRDKAARRGMEWRMLVWFILMVLFHVADKWLVGSRLG